MVAERYEDYERDELTAVVASHSCYQISVLLSKHDIEFSFVDVSGNQHRRLAKRFVCWAEDNGYPYDIALAIAETPSSYSWAGDAR